MLLLPMMLGCSATFRLYPVHGPLSAQTPLPVFPGKLTGLVNTGGISFVMPDGEVCKGRWTRVVPTKAPNGAATVNTPATNGMASVWDAVYGSGFYVSRVLGSYYYAHAAITETPGTVLNIEFYSADAGSKHIHIFGVAKDNKDNIFKMVFNMVGAP